MTDDRKISRADVVTIPSPRLKRGEALRREFATAKPSRVRAAIAGRRVDDNFAPPRVKAEEKRRAASAFFGMQPGFQATTSDPEVQRLRAMPAPHPAPTPRQIIASGGKLGRLRIADNPAANGDMPWYEFSGLQGVTDNEKYIVESAAKFGVDPDILRSIIWMETTHGAYDKIAQPFDLNKSILPMNINTEYWGYTWGEREKLKDSAANIAAGARMMKAISTAMPGQSLARRATVYNNSSADKVSDYGARVQRIYDEKPWKEISPRFATPWFIPPLP